MTGVLRAVRSWLQRPAGHRGGRPVDGRPLRGQTQVKPLTWVSSSWWPCDSNKSGGCTPCIALRRSEVRLPSRVHARRAMTRHFAALGCWRLDLGQWCRWTCGGQRCRAAAVGGLRGPVGMAGSGDRGCGVVTAWLRPAGPRVRGAVAACWDSRCASVSCEAPVAGNRCYWEGVGRLRRGWRGGALRGPRTPIPRG